MTKKMTRREALTNVVVFLRDNEQFGDDWSEEIEILDKMIASLDKQASRPKGKTSARIENEAFARQFIAKLSERTKQTPVNATWIAENVPFVRSSQKATHVAKIAVEWGAVSEITEKKRTYYVLNEFFETPPAWRR